MGRNAERPRSDGIIVTFEIGDIRIRLEQATQTCFSWRVFPNGTWGAVHQCTFTEALRILKDAQRSQAEKQT